MDSYEDAPMTRPTAPYIRTLAANLNDVHTKVKMSHDVALTDLCLVVANGEELRLPPGAVIVARRLLRESAERGNERAAALLEEAETAAHNYRLRRSLGEPVG
jgi:hypothetical protein